MGHLLCVPRETTKGPTTDAVVRRNRTRTTTGWGSLYTSIGLPYTNLENHVELLELTFERLFGIDSRFTLLYEVYRISSHVYRTPTPNPIPCLVST